MQYAQSFDDKRKQSSVFRSQDGNNNITQNLMMYTFEMTYSVTVNCYIRTIEDRWSKILESHFPREFKFSY